MNRHVVAYFVSTEAAQKALPGLEALGLSHEAMHIYGPEDVLGRGGELLPEGPGASTHIPDALFAGVQNLLADLGLAEKHQYAPVSAESAAAYAEALRRDGGVIVGVDVDEAHAARVSQILQEAGALDLNAPNPG